VNPAAFPQLMVAMAEGRAIGDVLRAVVDGVADCKHVALTRLWLIRPGDICGQCRFAAECPDRSRCLHLAASAGNPVDPSVDLRGVDGAFRRFPLGVRKIGRIAATGEPFVLRDLDGSEPWIVDPAWIRREGVRTFAGEPLVFRGEVLGVLGVFDRRPFDDESLRWLRTFADHAAVSLANARAFEEIEGLKRRLELENDYLREEVAVTTGTVGGFVGGSPGLDKVRRQIALVAPTEAAVLVAGESGTGKELVARAIHDASPRRSRALIKVNCGAVPENLFESEFFGHAKGAFTGALRDRVGRFELADGGTLFLDEIGEIPLAVQAKLLRVLQEKEFERVGETRTRRADVRIVAATNRDLRRECAEGRFREDLYFRLSVFPIEIPPLRERRDDVAPLAAHFAELAAKRIGAPAPRFARGQLAALERHDWPGNVRELQNAVERATILAQGGALRFDLPAPRTADDGGAAALRTADAGPPSSRGAATSADAAAEAPLETRASLRRRERDALVAALARTGGKVFGEDGAAALLGMKPTTLASRLKALGVDRRAARG
jgi:transcriptional regulator with GAF, ATPase, and Fis domain